MFDCLNNEIKIRDVDYKNVHVSCAYEIKFKLYESSTALPKCDGFNNYAIGFKHVDVGEEIKAGICYDMDALSLKFAMYVASSINVRLFKKVCTFFSKAAHVSFNKHTCMCTYYI